ncbi:MAG: hypothetical protein HGA67_00340 [Candidatus Yonathbacteria bacterium]|nr:hypothetical protein [Candidatus Yonathbacteria bacterium]
MDRETLHVLCNPQEAADHLVKTLCDLPEEIFSKARDLIFGAWRELTQYVAAFGETPEMIAHLAEYNKGPWSECMLGGEGHLWVNTSPTMMEHLGIVPGDTFYLSPDGRYADGRKETKKYARGVFYRVERGILELQLVYASEDGFFIITPEKGHVYTKIASAYPKWN